MRRQVRKRSSEPRRTVAEQNDEIEARVRKRRSQEPPEALMIDEATPLAFAVEA